MRYPNIEAERARSGMSKETLARELGVSRKTLHNWYCSGSIPQSALERMAALFECTVDYLRSQSSAAESITTYELVRELQKRPGVEKKTAKPYQDLSIKVNGPAIILIVTD